MSKYNIDYKIKALTLKLSANSDKGIDILKQSLVLRYCPNNGVCDPPILLENRTKVWTNKGHSTSVDINVFTSYKVDLPDPPLYINKEDTKFGMDTLRLHIEAIRGKYCIKIIDYGPMSNECNTVHIFLLWPLNFV